MSRRLAVLWVLSVMLTSAGPVLADGLVQYRVQGVMLGLGVEFGYDRHHRESFSPRLEFGYSLANIWSPHMDKARWAVWSGGLRMVAGLAYAPANGHALELFVDGGAMTFGGVIGMDAGLALRMDWQRGPLLGLRFGPSLSATDQGPCDVVDVKQGLCPVAMRAQDGDVVATDWDLHATLFVNSIYVPARDWPHCTDGESCRLVLGTPVLRATFVQ